jgi:hypothetical protein
VSSPVVITPLSKISDISHHPPGPLPGGEILCPRSDFSRHPPVLYQEGRSFVRDRTFSRHPPVLYREGWSFVRDRTFSRHPPVFYREGWSFVRDRTFLVTPLSSTGRGGPLSEIGLFSSPPCPLPGGVVLSPKLDFPHEVLYSSSSLFSSF